MTEQLQISSRRGAFWETPGQAGRRPSRKGETNQQPRCRMEAALQAGRSQFVSLGLSFEALKVWRSPLSFSWVHFCECPREVPLVFNLGFNATESNSTSKSLEWVGPIGARGRLTSAVVGQLLHSRLPICPGLGPLEICQASARLLAPWSTQEREDRAEEEGRAAKLLGLK